MATEKAGETEVTILFQNERVRVAEMRARPGNRAR
jgi:hypothetical protein